MRRLLGSLALAASLCLAPAALEAQQTAAPQKAAAAPKAGKGEKVCRIRMKYSGELKTFVCKQAEPCCAWHEINYVKCGSTITGCL